MMDDASCRPTSHSTSFKAPPGEHANFDMRVSLNEAIAAIGLEHVHVLNGAFMGNFLDGHFGGIFDWDRGTASFWGIPGGGPPSTISIASVALHRPAPSRACTPSSAKPAAPRLSRAAAREAATLTRLAASFRGDPAGQRAGALLLLLAAGLGRPAIVAAAGRAAAVSRAWACRERQSE